MPGNKETQYERHVGSSDADNKRPPSKKAIANTKLPSLSIKVHQPKGIRPDGFETLPEELQIRPALYGRTTMKGVAIPNLKDDSSSSSDSEGEEKSKLDNEPFTTDMELDLDSEVAALNADVGLDIHTLYYSRTTRSTAQSKKKKKKGTPIHLQWSADEDGDDEEPTIIAPGWNLPQYVPRGRGRTHEFEKDVESSETEKTTKSSKPKTQGTKRKVAKENEMDPRQAAALKNALIGEGIIR